MKNTKQYVYRQQSIFPLPGILKEHGGTDQVVTLQMLQNNSKPILLVQNFKIT